MPVYLPFSAVATPLAQTAAPFTSSSTYSWSWYPFAPVVDAGWNEALWAVIPVVNDAYHELLNFPLPVGQANVVIPFQFEKVSPVLLLSGPMIVNTVDNNPLSNLSFTITNISTSLLAVSLSANVDSANYLFQGLVTVVG